jgi:hypothetical protein
MMRPLQPHWQATLKYGLYQIPSRSILRVNADQHVLVHSALQPQCAKNAVRVLAV